MAEGDHREPRVITAEHLLREVGESPASRWSSLLLVAIYVAGVGATAGLLLAIGTFGVCVIPLACIWFPNVFEYPVRPTIGRDAWRTPPDIVWLIGWMWLLGFGALISWLWFSLGS
jgi:hypothetical protein